MNNYRRLPFILLAMSLLAVFVPEGRVQACSGGAEPVSLNWAVENAEVIVRATVVERDDSGRNAILQVERYLQGSGPTYLLWYRVDPTLTAVRSNHRFDTGCLYDGWNPVQLYQPLYVALWRLQGGAYETVKMYQYEPLVFTRPIDYSVPVRMDPDAEEGGDNFKYVDLANEQQFENLISRLNNSSPTEPSESDSRDILPAPIRLYTDVGKQYILPVDTQLPFGVQNQNPASLWSDRSFPNFWEAQTFCVNVGCKLDSPDSSMYAYKRDWHTIYLDYYYADNWQPNIVEGIGFSFSSTGEMFITWTDDRLSIYLISNDQCMNGICTDGWVPRLELIRTIPIHREPPLNHLDFHNAIRWSADGTTMAFVDSKGLWIYDPFRQHEPSLILEPRDQKLPKVLFLSTSGRFVAYSWLTDEDQREWQLLDRLAGQEYANLLPSPDERFFAQVLPNENDNTTSPSDICEMSHDDSARNCWLIAEKNLRYFIWIDNDLALELTESSTGNCDLRVLDVTYLQWYQDPYAQYGQLDESVLCIPPIVHRTITAGQIVVFAKDSHTIGLYPLGNQSYFTSIDLAESVEGNITQLEWGKSYFFFRD